MKLFKNKWFILTQAVLTSLVALFYSSCRLTFYFVDRVTFGGATICMLGLFALSSLVGILCFFFYEKMSDKVLGRLSVTGFVILIIGIGMSVTFVILGWGTMEDFGYFFKKSLPYFLLIWFAVTLCVVLPRCGAKPIVSIVLCIVFTLSVLLAYFRPLPFKLTAQPTVFVAGEGKYSVVWATSSPSIGKLEIQKDGVSHIYWDEVAGNPRTDDKVHHVSISSEMLDGCEYYCVKNEQVKERTGYSLWRGKTLESEHYSFRAVSEDADKLNIYSLSDWHERYGFAQDTKSHFEQADVLIMCGDSMNMVNAQYSVIDYLLKPCGEISASSIPVIYAKGNHECRGSYSVNLMRDLGLESFYFTYRLGSLSGVVLDMGECYGDDFPEYFGAADYETYRDTEESWLMNVNLPQTRYRLAVCHDELFEAGENGRNKREGISQSLNEKGVQLLVAGHEHIGRYLPAGENGRDFHTFVDGGINANDFVAGLISIQDEQCTLKAVHRNGEIELEESFILN